MQDTEISFFDSLKKELKLEGFPLVGGVDLSTVDALILGEYTGKYDQWIQSGYAGEMNYLVRGRDRRADIRLVFPDVKSVITVAMPYPAASHGQVDPTKGVRYARYIRGRDYHLEMPEKMERALQKISLTHSDLKWKICVDTSAVQERVWAALTGIGWIGKNSMLIHPQRGSYLLLGEILLNQEVSLSPKLLPNYCGECTRCLNACPTEAFGGPRVLNSTKCISYQTLEKRGEMSFTPELKSRIGNWVAGCDICQEVCPFNTKAAKAALENQPEIVSAQSSLDQTSLYVELELETRETYQTRVKESSLNRVKYEQFRRNLGIIADVK